MRVAVWLALAGIAGCATGGQIYVSRPQVFTRERLVEERYRDSEWVRGKLDTKEFEKVKPVNAGLHDFRTFSGITATISADLSPGGVGTPSGGSAPIPQQVKVPDELKSSAGTIAADAKLDAIQELEFQEAVRARINGMLRQSQLDDTHDLKGNTMYRLQFQVAAVPGYNTSDFGVIQLRLRGPHDYLCEHVDPSNIRAYQPDEPYFKQLHEALARPEPDSSPDTSDRICVKNTPDCIASLRRLKEQVCERVYADTMFVAEVEPREYAQNISEVAAAEQFAQLVAAVQATSGQPSVSGQGYTEAVRKSLELSQSLRQQPLVVGYASGHDTFGWIIGPQFAIAGDHATWQQFPKYYSVSAAISVPAWWPWILLDGRVGWRGRDGTTTWNRSAWYRWPWLRSDKQGENATSSELKTYDSRVDSDGRDAFYRIAPRAPLWGGELKVQLPGDLAAINSGNAYASHGRSRDAEDNRSQNPFLPEIHEPKSVLAATGSRVHLKSTDCVSPTAREESAARSDQAIYIRGRELWRSAQVYVGSQRSSRVEILPDMKGLVAHFDTVIFPTEDETARRSESSPQDLRVVTSIGEAKARSVVVIHKAPCGGTSAIGQSKATRR